MQGFSGAQFNLGNMYYLGKGVERDWPEAERWYRLAMEQGHRHAVQFLKRLEEERNIEELDSTFVIQLVME